MKTPTFQEQYNKIVKAYYRNELDPWNTCACFIGNLLNNKTGWEDGRDIHTCSIEQECLYAVEYALKVINRESNYLYSYQEIIDLEGNFLRIVYRNTKMSGDSKYSEEDLFDAMVSTLEMLKKLHESKGEIVTEYNFTKRELV